MHRTNYSAWTMTGSTTFFTFSNSFTVILPVPGPISSTVSVAFKAAYI